MIRIWIDSSTILRMMIRLVGDSTSTKWFEHDSIRNVQHDSAWFEQKNNTLISQILPLRSVFSRGVSSQKWTCGNLGHRAECIANLSKTHWTYTYISWISSSQSTNKDQAVKHLKLGKASSGAANCKLCIGLKLKVQRCFTVLRTQKNECVGQQYFMHRIWPRNDSWSPSHTSTESVSSSMHHAMGFHAENINSHNSWKYGRKRHQHDRQFIGPNTTLIW